MIAKLVVEDGDLKGLSLTLDEGETWTLGSDPDESQLVIEDPLISRRHLSLHRTSEGITAENLSAADPVLLNDEQMDEGEHLLQNGDLLKVGNQVLRYYEDSDAHIVSAGENEGMEESEKDMEESEEDEEEEEFKEIEESETGNKSEIVSEAGDESEKSETAAEEPGEVAEAREELPASEEPPLKDSEPPFSPGPESSSIQPPPQQDTLFAEENEDIGSLAHIDFGVVEAGRWLLKVVSGPNNGAEFHMHSGNQYMIGTDPRSCDIVFHDNSVSRQHARITITPEDILSIEDMRSRNGVLVNGIAIEEKHILAPNTIVTLGTTSFVVYDREGEMLTIVSPLLPSIAKVLQQEPEKSREEEKAAEPSESIANEPETPVSPPAHTIVPPEQKPARHFGPYIIFTAIIGLFVLAGIGTTTLFNEKPVAISTQENAVELLDQAVKPFPAIRWTFNKSNGSLLLLGHVSTVAEKNQLLYNLKSLNFVKNIDDNGIIIDEGVWNEVNSLLSSNPAWKGITIHSPAAGQFVLSGELQTRKQAEQLSSYLSLNFPYLDLLKKQIVVEEDVMNQITVWLQNVQLFDVTAKMANGDVTLSGLIPPDKTEEFNQVIAKIKQIPGVRIVTNLTKIQTIETGITNITNHYTVTGKSRIGNKYTVVINGRILSEGDDLDGMRITQITANRVFLEQHGDRFRIDY